MGIERDVGELEDWKRRIESCISSSDNFDEFKECALPTFKETRQAFKDAAKRSVRKE